jgi:lipopolysaccharide export system protein LptA
LCYRQGAGILPPQECAPTWAGNDWSFSRKHGEFMNKLLKQLIFLSLTVLPMVAWGLSSDRQQPMMIEADRVELDDAKGISTYRGRVKVAQGTLLLTGETMTVHNRGNQIEKVIVKGNPATYQQRPDNKDQDVHAKALRMEYYTNPEHIILLKQAEVEQQGDVLRSERIEYDMVKDLVSAGTDQPDERVQITIQPKTEKEPQKPSAKP